LIAADRKRKEEARKKSEEESRRREEERLAKEEARRSEEEKEKKSKNEQSVPALSVTQPRVHSVLYDEKPMVSMYKTSSPLVTVSAADDAAPGSLSADSAWRDQKDALDVKGYLTRALRDCDRYRCFSMAFVFLSDHVVCCAHFEQQGGGSGRSIAEEAFDVETRCHDKETHAHAA
jgi:hypothetical protein